jgi:putative transposase
VSKENYQAREEPPTHDNAERIAPISVSEIVRAETGRRISYKPGGLFVFRGEPVQIVSELPIGFKIRNLRTQADTTAHLHELEPMALGAQPESAISISELSGATPEEWERARKIEAALRALMSSGASAQSDAEAAAALDISVGHLHRLRSRYERNPMLSVLLRQRPGRKLGSRLIAETAELIMTDTIRAELHVSPDISVDDLRDLIEGKCRAARVPTPGRTTVAQRLRVARNNPANLPAEIGEELRRKQTLVPSPQTADEPLSCVQMDHTVCDVMIVDPISREQIARPILTLAIDVATRVILGMLLSLEAPSALSVGLCLQHAVFPKATWLRAMGLQDHGWPGFGVPLRVHVDNAKEFHSLALQLGCNQYHISLTYRRKGEPTDGAIIERHIGTNMGKVRLIPGATYSKQLRERPPHPEKLACFTLQELYQYLAREIARQHLKRPDRLRSGKWLGKSPQDMWEHGWHINGRRAYPEVPESSDTFLLYFLPCKKRVVSREGIQLFGGLTYRSPSLEPLIARGVRRVVRYDPRDLARVYVERDKDSHVIARLVNSDMPAFSLWEWHELKRQHLKPRNPKDAAAMRRALEDNRRLVHAKSRSQRAMRARRRMVREEAWRAAQDAAARRIAMLEAETVRTKTHQIEERALDCEVLE